MHDAIALANLIYAVPTTNSADLTKIFEEYQKERLPAVIESFNNSQLMSKIMDRGIEGAIILWLYTNIPFWLWRLMVRPSQPTSFVLLFVDIEVGTDRHVPCMKRRRDMKSGDH